MIDLKIYNSSEVNGTAYIEIARSDSNQSIGMGKRDSLYVDDVAFSLALLHPFYLTRYGIDMYGVNQYSKDEMNDLLKHLTDNQRTINDLQTPADFVKFIQRNKFSYLLDDEIPVNQKDFNDVKLKMLEMNARVLQFVKESQSENKVLTVLGI